MGAPTGRATDEYEGSIPSLVTNVQRINNKDAHRSNDSGAPRLGNDCTHGGDLVLT
jgi:hypothetical protein